MKPQTLSHTYRNSSSMYSQSVPALFCCGTCPKTNHHWLIECNKNHRMIMINRFSFDGSPIDLASWLQRERNAIHVLIRYCSSQLHDNTLMSHISWRVSTSKSSPPSSLRQWMWRDPSLALRMGKHIIGPNWELGRLINLGTYCLRSYNIIKSEVYYALAW